MGAVAKANPKKQTKKTEAGKHGQFPIALQCHQTWLAGKSPINGGKKAGKIIERNGESSTASHVWLPEDTKSDIVCVCLKIGYIPNYSHLIGIMIINHWV